MTDFLDAEPSALPVREPGASLRGHIDSASHASSSLAGLASFAPSDGVLTHSKPAPSDGSNPTIRESGIDSATHTSSSLAGLASLPASIPSLVRLDHEEAVQAALVALGEAALAWYAADPDQPEGIEAESVLSDAVSAYRAVTNR